MTKDGIGNNAINSKLTYVSGGAGANRLFDKGSTQNLVSCTIDPTTFLALASPMEGNATDEETFVWMKNQMLLSQRAAAPAHLGVEYVAAHKTIGVAQSAVDGAVTVNTHEGRHRMETWRRFGCKQVIIVLELDGDICEGLQRIQSILKKQAQVQAQVQAKTGGRQLLQATRTFYVFPQGHEDSDAARQSVPRALLTLKVCQQVLDPDLYVATGAISTQMRSTQMRSTQMPSKRMPSTQMPSTQMPSKRMPSTQMRSTQMPSKRMRSKQMRSTQKPRRAEKIALAGASPATQKTTQSAIPKAATKTFKLVKNGSSGGAGRSGGNGDSVGDGGGGGGNVGGRSVGAPNAAHKTLHKALHKTLQKKTSWSNIDEWTHSEF